MPLDSESVRVRAYRPDDLGLLYGICLQTADNGQDATGLFSNPQLPGDVYVAPYVTFEPSLAFVAEDAAGVGGYIVAALDSRRFERAAWLTAALWSTPRTTGRSRPTSPPPR